MSCGGSIDPSLISVPRISKLKSSCRAGESHDPNATDRVHPVPTIRSAGCGGKNCNAPTGPFLPWERAFHNVGMARCHAHQYDWDGVSTPRVDLRPADAAQDGVAESADRARDGLRHEWLRAAAVCCTARPGATGDGWLPRSAFHSAGLAVGNGWRVDRRPVSASLARAQPVNPPASSCFGEPPDIR